MRTGCDDSAELAVEAPGSVDRPYRDAPAIAELFVGVFRRDLLNFFPQSTFEVEPCGSARNQRGGPDFRILEGNDDGPLVIELFGERFRLGQCERQPLSSQERRMVRAIGAVLSLRYHHLFQISNAQRLELYRGGSEDHFVAAFVEPGVYEPTSGRTSRIASTIHTLRTAALSTYENRRVSTGVLLVGSGDDSHRESPPTPPDALPYGVGLTGLKSLHRLCDGTRTLFRVDRAGRLADIIDVERWAAEIAGPNSPEVPCARAYESHARATRSGGHICMVLSPNQEIKLFAGGSQTFAFSHARWRILDPSVKYASWRRAVGSPGLARVLFQAALDLAERRQGGLFVVLDDPAAAVGRLIASHDCLWAEVPDGPPAELPCRDPLARRAFHYLARDRNVIDLDPPVLEALASLDGAIATDRFGRLMAFGAILRQDAIDLPGLDAAEGARTTAALAASRFGSVLKVSEDGVVSCFLGGARAWDL